MDAFSALATNPAPTASSPPPSSPSSSPTTSDAFASHLQSATQQQSTEQRAEAPKIRGMARTQQSPAEQAADAPSGQPLASQAAHLNSDPGQADAQKSGATDGATADPLAATEAMASVQSALPPRTIHAQATGQTDTGSQPSTMARMLDAIASPSPAPINGGPGGQAPPAATTEAGVQQIVVASAANIPATASLSQPLAADAAPVPTSPLSSLQSTNTLAQPMSQPTGAQSSVPNPTSTIVFHPTTDMLSMTSGIDGESVLPPTVDEPGAPLVVQNQYSQIITIQQNSALPVTPEPQGASPAAPLTSNTGTDLDLTNQYIHSHLPNETATKGEDAGNRSGTNNESGQFMPSNQTPQTAEPQTAVEPLFTAQSMAPSGQESQPLIFSHQQFSGLTSAPLTTSTTSTAAPDSALYRLASGATVPDGTVVDQMIAHFSINKGLESGSVNLRLHPQELGALRMEITVEQDNVKAHIVTQSPHAQEMIDRHLPKLREALEQQGLHLGQVEVTVASNDNAAGERFQESTTRQQSHHSMGAKPSQSLFDLDLDLDEEIGVAAAVDNNLSVIA